MGQFLAAMGRLIIIISFLIATAYLTNQVTEFTAPPTAKPTLMSSIPGSHKRAVPRSLGLKRVRFELGAASKAEITFASSGFEKQKHLLVELWFYEPGLTSCYVTSLGQKEPPGLSANALTVYASSALVSKLKPAGSFEINGKIVRISFKSMPSGKPTFATVRWLPDDLYTRSPEELWTASVSPLLPPGIKGIWMPFLQFDK